MNQEEQSAREKLLNATVACIEKEGLHSVTIRSIAKEAGVNSAAINYYFGTKDKLVEAALQQAMNNAMENFGMFDEKTDDPYQVLQAFFRHNFEGIVNYPEISKAHLYTPFIKNEYEQDTKDWFNGFLGHMMEAVRGFMPAATEIEVKITVMQIISALVFPGIFSGLFREFLGVDIKDPEFQGKYVDYLVEHYFKRDN